MRSRSISTRLRRRNFQRWNILGTYVWPNFFVADTYPEELNFMKGWLENRLSWYDSNYVSTPVFNQDGGGFDCTLRPENRLNVRYGLLYDRWERPQAFRWRDQSPGAEINGAGSRLGSRLTRPKTTG